MDKPELIDIELLKQGDEYMFRKLVDVYATKVYNLFWLLLRHEKDAEDLTQEVFTSVFLYIGQFEGKSTLSTWIYRIANNKYKELIRHHSRKKRFGIHLPFDLVSKSDYNSSDMNHPHYIMESKERTEIIRTAIQQLPDQQQMAFSLHKIDGLNHYEIAQIMDLSKSAVESLIFRAKKKLQEILQKYYIEN